MKKIILIAILVSSFTANAQSLKDALFGGKLKNDSGTVVRKTDDLSTKIDTSKKKPAETEKTIVTSTIKDSSITTDSNTQSGSAANPATTPVNTPNTTAIIKDNNKIWKDYTDSLAAALKEEVLPNKKIKSGTYYILTQYEIGTDGQVSINSVSCSPENEFLEKTIRERLTLTAPQMNPVLSNYGKPIKSSKKYTLTLSKL